MYASSSVLANSTTVLSSAAAATVIGATNASTDAGTSITYTVPAGAQVGDLLLAITSQRGSATIAAPGGWTGHTQYAQGTTISQRVHHNYAASGDLTTTHTFTLGATPVKAAGVLIVLRGAVAPFLTSMGQGNASATSIAIPGLTMAAQNVILIIAASKAHSDPHSQASGYTLLPTATVASGGTATTANRVSVHTRMSALANPPSTAIAAGTVAAVSVGVHMALVLGAEAPEAVVATAGVLTLTGRAGTLTEAPVQLAALEGAYDLDAINTELEYLPTWQTLSTLGAIAASYSDTTAAPATTYRYRIVALSGGGGQTISNEATATTISGSTYALILEPRVFALTAATSGATLGTQTLTALGGTVALAGGSATLDYTPPVFEVIDTVGALIHTYSDFGLEPGTTYVYRIVAVNAASLETASNEVVVTTPSGLIAYSLTAAAGLYTNVPVTVSTLIAEPATRGTVALTGPVATLTNVREVIAAAGAYTLATLTASVVAATRLAALKGTLALTGTAATVARTVSGQQAVPVADVTDGLWTPSSGVHLYATIDDPSDDAPADVDYMRTVNPVDDEAVVELSDLATPVAGDVHVLVRARKV